MNKTIMKKICALLIGGLFMLSACQDPEYVKPTVERQEITSITAIFTSGTFVDQEMGKLTVEDASVDKFVIPIPWYYPTTSDDETEQYMTNVRVTAEIEANCFIEPALGILDLTKDNYFTFTNAQGVKRQICITGERVKSSDCELQSFVLQDPVLSGVVDKTNKKVSLVSVDDLSSCLATAAVSAHATISPDPSVTPLNYNEEQKFTITAHDGTTQAVYTVVKEVPEKIASGFNTSSLELLFNFDPVSNLGMPNYATSVCPSLAAVGSNLVICLGDGSTPVYLNKLTGVKLGTINLGSAVAGSVTSDEGGNMLIINKVDGGGTVNIYRTSSVTEAPTLFYSFTNTSSLPVGTKMKVIGNIDTDAQIVITHAGIAGVTSADSFTVIQVKDGAVTDVSIKNFTSAGVYWGAAPVNIGTVVGAAVDPSEGYFESCYDQSKLFYVKGDGTLGASLPSDLTGWGLNPNCLDSKQFNNVNYMALFVVSHFPSWGMGPQLYLYDVNDKSLLSGDNVSSPSCLVLSNAAVEWYQTASYGVASGDVLIAPSADGFTIYLYYYDHNSGVIGGYSADCIAR